MKVRFSWRWRFWYWGVAFYTVSWQPIVIQVGPWSMALIHSEKLRLERTKRK